MEEIIKVVLADDNRNFCGVLESWLSSKDDMELVGIANNGVEALSVIAEQQPDVLLLDLVIPGLDGLGVMEKMGPVTKARLKVIMMSYFTQEVITEQARSLGVDCFLRKPLDIGMLEERIRQVVNNPVRTNAYNYWSGSSLPNIETRISDVLRKIGIPVDLRGYQYLRDAIRIAADNRTALHGVTKGLYPAIAEKYDTRASYVERSIRYVIRKAWERPNRAKINDIFGFAGRLPNGPTNSQFIARVVELLRIQSN